MAIMAKEELNFSILCGQVSGLDQPILETTVVAYIHREMHRCLDYTKWTRTEQRDNQTGTKNRKNNNKEED